MKTALIIPIFNQKKYWLRMLTAIETQSVMPDVVYVMLDRQSDSDYESIKLMCSSSNIKGNYKVFNIHEIPEYIGRPTSLPDQTLFLTGDRRNRAIDMAINEGCECFIMIDGDCIPDVDLVKSHKKACMSEMPVMGNGRRRDVNYEWMDKRDVDPNLRYLELFINDGTVIHSVDLLRSCSITWSCNLSANRKAVKIIKAINKKYYGRDEFFNSEFLGSWGGEDSFLGIQANLGKVFIVILGDEDSSVRHIDHPRPESKYGNNSFGPYLISHISLLNSMQSNNPLTLDFYNEVFSQDAPVCE